MTQTMLETAKHATTAIIFISLQNYFFSFRFRFLISVILFFAVICLNQNEVQPFVIQRRREIQIMLRVHSNNNKHIQNKTSEKQNKTEKNKTKFKIMKSDLKIR